MKRLFLFTVLATALTLGVGAEEQTQQKLGEETEETETAVNELSLSGARGYAGRKVALPISLTNTQEIVGFQLNLHLPDGVSVAEDEEGEPLVTFSERTTDEQHFVATYKLASGAIRVVCSSDQNKVFAGNEGVVFSLMLNTDADMAVDDYEVSVSDIVLSDKRSKTYEPNDVTTTLTITVLGDVNGDKSVNVGDIMAIINYMAGMRDSFTAEVADVNGDGKVNVGDIMAVINIMASK